MPFYKDINNNVHFIESDYYEYLLPPSSVQITNEEASQLTALTLDQIKGKKETEIKAERDRRAQSGGYKVGSNWFHSDTFSRTQQLGLVMMGSAMPPGIQWKTMSGAFVTMTQQLAAQIFAAAAASDAAIYAAAETHIASMKASADPANYNYSTGWPTVFGE